ncbi:DUF6894 family protein [Bradyrhizobium tunisiense]|uniref:DUF6894 family protein n=1 Tax=Bradyrhizobium tunisiense TaxID=3278709 RepID=UPI0035DC2552
MTASVPDRKLDGLNVPRYHFDLVDSKTVTDEGGAELADDIQALDVAEEIARRLSQERPELRGRHFAILVTNQDREVIGRVPLDLLH